MTDQPADFVTQLKAFESLESCKGWADFTKPYIERQIAQLEDAILNDGSSQGIADREQKRHERDALRNILRYVRDSHEEAREKFKKGDLSDE